MAPFPCPNHVHYEAWRDHQVVVLPNTHAIDRTVKEAAQRKLE